MLISVNCVWYTRSENDSTGQCNNPACPHYQIALKHDECLQCKVRQAMPLLNDTAPTLPRPDLQGVQATLPAFVEGRDRPVHFEPSGAIVYEKENWEPPRDIDGYRRDPQDPWRFLPLWPVCALRLCTGVRLVNCGCIGVIMRCNDPRSTVLGQQVKYSQCAQCKLPEKNA